MYLSTIYLRNVLNVLNPNALTFKTVVGELFDFLILNSFTVLFSFTFLGDKMFKYILVHNIFDCRKY